MKAEVYTVGADVGSIKLVTQDGIALLLPNGIGDGDYRVVIAWDDEQFCRFLDTDTYDILQWTLTGTTLEIPEGRSVFCHDYDCDPSDPVREISPGWWWVYRNPDGDMAFVRKRDR